MPVLTVLCIIYQGSRVLLGIKKKGFGAGRWNGFGGKVEGGEFLEDAVRREVFEESGIRIKNLEKAGVMTFTFQDKTPNHEVYIFRSRDFEGEAMESDEMKPQWFSADNLPFDEMWPADTYWLPLLLAGKKFSGTIVYDRPSTVGYTSRIIEKDLREVSEL